MNKYSKNNNIIINKAFSLIELSIVLIIIGLLVAGVTGGKSLIDSARSRALINEIREYERAVWTFRAARDRFPGDVMNYGTFGFYSNYYDPTSTSGCSARPGYQYEKTDFSAPYDTGTFTPNHYSAPFVDLYTEGIIDFKPLGNSATADKSSTTKGTPNSETLQNTYFYFAYTKNKCDSYYIQSPAKGFWWLGGIYDIGNIKEAFRYVGNNIDPKLLKQIDLKLDDGEYWNGIFRSLCHGKKGSNGLDNGYTDYDYAIDDGKKCSQFFYAI